MERPSKLADLTLVSKYYPVTNYSYPRKESSSQHDRNSAAIDRSSYGSGVSTPGLTDDRTDSEVSFDDDYQYHTHGAQLWDSFWQQQQPPPPSPQPSPHRKRPEASLSMSLSKQTRTFVTSPSSMRQRRQTEPEYALRCPVAWPLPDSPSRQARQRKHTASYSPLPKPINLVPRTKSPIPSWESSRPMSQPRRPPRPDDKLLTPCLQPSSPVPAIFTSFDFPAPPSSLRPQSSLEQRQRSPVRHQRSKTSLGKCLPHPIQEEPERPSTALGTRSPTPTEPQRPKTPHGSRSVSDALSIPFSKFSIDNRPPTPFEPEIVVSPLTSYFPVPEVPQEYWTMQVPHCHTKDRPRLRGPLELQSVFEDDDSDQEEDTRRSFFRFQKRSGSDLRRTARSQSANPKRPRSKSRTKSDGSTYSDRGDSNNERKSYPATVLGRMLGRRSR